jgi:uncharacterized membrane protein YfhO
MKKIKEFIRINFFVVMSFIIPIIILSLIFIKMGMYPFGNKTILTSDMKGQYVHFFSAYKDIILKGKSLFYSWNAGMGLNFIGIFSYYVSSPLNIILLLVPNKYLVVGILVILLIKIGLSGCFFSIYLKYKFKKNDSSILLFSIMYAFISYSIVYSYNIMWLDGVFLLPIVLMGVEKLIRENKVVFFIISLIILFVSNFYIAFMVGLFSVLYFFTAYFTEKSVINYKELFRSLFTYIISGIIAVGCVSVIMIPTYYSLKAGESPFSSLPGWGMNFNVFDIFSRLLVGSYDTPLNGLPNIFCGVMPILILPLFYTNKNIQIKEKVIYTLLLGFMLVSLDNERLNVIWHGLHVPSCFPYRYSFLVSFIILIIAYKAFINFNHININDLVKSFVIICFFVVLIQKIGYSYLSTINYYLTFAFLIIYFSVLYIFSKCKIKYRQFISIILIFIVMVEVFTSSYLLLSKVDKMLGFSSINEYQSFVEKYKPTISKIQKDDKSFYRMGKTFFLTHNDSLSLEYNGIGSFTSTANQNLNIMLNSLGFYGAASNQEMEYEGATIITDSIFGVKYILSKNKINNYYTKYYDDKNVQVYKNPFELPIGFLVSNKLNNYSATENCFENQNNILRLMDGNQNNETYFKPISNVEVKLNNLTVTKNNGFNQYIKIDPSKEASIEYTVKQVGNYPIYGFLRQNSTTNGASVYIDGKLENNYYIHNYYKSYILEIDKNNSSNSKTIKISLNDNELTMKDELFYYLDMAKTENTLNKLSYNTLNVTKYNDTSISGNVKVTDNKLLFTSIPYDSGWSVKVDGKNANIHKVMGALIGVEMQKGNHTIEFDFIPKGLYQGLLISIISIIVLIGLLFYEFRKKNNNK